MAGRARRNGAGRFLLLLGIGMLACAFVYDLLLAGIPYQDPTPQMQARWQFHRDIAELGYLAGLIAVAVGAAALLLRRRRG